MDKISLKNGDQITAKHLGYGIKIMTWVISVLFTLLGTLITVIYNDYKGDINKYIDEQKVFNEEMLDGSLKQSIKIDVLKEHIEHRDSIEFDHKINERYRFEHPNRGATIGNFAPDELLASPVFH